MFIAFKMSNPQNDPILSSVKEFQLERAQQKQKCDELRLKLADERIIPMLMKQVELYEKKVQEIQEENKNLKQDNEVYKNDNEAWRNQSTEICKELLGKETTKWGNCAGDTYSDVEELLEEINKLKEENKKLKKKIININDILTKSGNKGYVDKIKDVKDIINKQ